MDTKTKMMIVGGVAVVIIAGIAIGIRNMTDTSVTQQPEGGQQPPQEQQASMDDMLKSVTAPVDATSTKVSSQVIKSITAPAPKRKANTAPIVDQAVLDSLTAPAKQ